MKKSLFTALFVILFVSVLLPQNKFSVDLSDTTNHLFKVTLIPEALGSNNKVYQFAASAPGTYEIMDIGRYVQSFKAYDSRQNEISSKNISTNQWEISDPVHTAKIEYIITDTWHSSIKKNAPYLMTGSSLEKDNALINGQCIFGYLTGMQSVPVNVKIVSPSGWEIATALTKNNDGYYTADNYDMLVDSPFLLGDLTEAETQIGKCKVELFTWSKTGLIKSEEVLSAVSDILKAEDKFIDGLPVDHYTFLFHFGDVTFGAWEHMYSSEYVYTEQPLTGAYKESLVSGIAHEFFHIVTPLNIHSQLVEPFNFVNPVMSQHLWFYEGITEWAAWMLQLRGGLISLEEYIQNMKQQLAYIDFFKKDVSLRVLSINAYNMQDQYQNIYKKGSVTAELLDIYLLKLSGGEMGLRDVIIKLLKKYGPDKSFDENSFFDEFVKLTYPEIKTFIDNYIIHSAPLPVKEYLVWLGIDYQEFAGIDSSRIDLGFGVSVSDNNIVISNVQDTSATEMRTGDKLSKILETTVTLQNVQQAFAQLVDKKPGDEIALTLTRGGKDFQVNWMLPPAKRKHVFEIMKSSSEQQLQLRNVWMKNH